MRDDFLPLVTAAIAASVAIAAVIVAGAAVEMLLTVEQEKNSYRTQAAELAAELVGLKLWQAARSYGNKNGSTSSMAAAGRAGDEVGSVGDGE